MSAITPTISHLSPRTVCCLRKGCSLLSPWQCVEELVSNSLDSEAASIAVRLDLDIRDIRIQVVDDGRGMTKGELGVVGKQFWTSKRESRGEALASLRRVAKLVSVSSKVDNDRTFKTEFVRGKRGGVERESVSRSSSGTTVTVSGFLWNQEVRRKMVKDFSDMIEVKMGLLATALVHPMVRFILVNNTKGRKEMMLNTPRAETAAQVFCGLFCSRLGDSVREVLHEDMEGKIRVTGFLCMEPHHTRELQFISVNSKTIFTSQLHREVQNLFMKTKSFQDGKSSTKTFPVFALQLQIPPDSCYVVLEQRKTMVMFKNKTNVLEILTSTVKQFLSDQGPTQPALMSPSPESLSPFMSGVKTLHPTQLFNPITTIQTKKFSQFLFSPKYPGGRTSCPAYRRRLQTQLSEDVLPLPAVEENSHVRNTFFSTLNNECQEKISSSLSKSTYFLPWPNSKHECFLPSPTPKHDCAQDWWSEEMDTDNSFQEIFIESEEGEEEEDIPDYVMSFSGEDCHPISHLPSPPPPSMSPQSTLPFIQSTPLATPSATQSKCLGSPIPIVWSNHNFAFHKSPQALVLTKIWDRGIKLVHSMVEETTLIGQVEDRYLATICRGKLLLWDQHAVHERIRLEEMVASSLSPDRASQSLRIETLQSPLLVSLSSETETAAVLSRPEDCARWGLGVVGTEDTSTIIITDIPHCLSFLDTEKQVEVCQALLLELGSITMSKVCLPTFPRTVLDHLATQACRGAIMFGQTLSQDRCRQLLQSLVHCRAPFQCAHGRPSVAVLCEINLVKELGNWEKPKWNRLK